MNNSTQSDSRRQDAFWNQLLAVIARGKMVPVIGEDLLQLSDTDGALLYDEIAQRYADYAGLELSNDASARLSSTVRSHPEFKDNPHDIYQSIGEELELLNPPIPTPLVNLAKIKAFSLFITTTFDNLLERALNQVRYDGKPLTQVIAYSPKQVPSDQVISDALASGRPVIFQLFGSYKQPLQFALTEGDKVEYMHSLQSAQYCPKRLFNELNERPLIMLGNKFPDWLTRSFLRMVRKTPLDHKEVPQQYFANIESTQDPVLRFFLQRFTTNTKIIDGQDPAQFIEALSERWQQLPTKEQKTIVPNNISPNRPMARNAVFISYCASTKEGLISDDREVAIALRNALEDVGINVWLDLDQLKGGDEYERKIERYINTCSLFIPIISKTSNERAEGFFRKEWSWALRRLPDFTGSDRSFIFPVNTDSIDPYTALIPEEFKRYHFSILKPSGPDPTFIETIKTVYTRENNPLGKESVGGR